MIFLDANIILELAIPGRPKLASVETYLATATEPTVVSVLTAHIVLYFGRKYPVPDSQLHSFINLSEVIALLPADYEWATLYEQDRDFEDALQIASAIRFGCSEFVTLDKRLAKAYKDGPLTITLLS